jgi:hypothetical protein
MRRLVLIAIYITAITKSLYYRRLIHPANEDGITKELPAPWKKRGIKQKEEGHTTKEGWVRGEGRHDKLNEAQTASHD